MNTLFSKPALLASSYQDWEKLKILVSDTIDKSEKCMHDAAKYILEKKNLACKNGLLPEEVRKNSKYIQLKKEFHKDLAALREFNGNSPKKYKQKYSRESRSLKK